MKQYIQYNPTTGAITAAVRSVVAPIVENQIELNFPLSIVGRVVNLQTLDIIDVETGDIFNKQTGVFEPDPIPTPQETGFLATVRGWFSR